MPFNQMFTGRTLSAVSAKCSFTDPYIGGGGGYVQVTRASGEGPVLLVLPEGGGGLEGWRPLKQEDSKPNPSPKPKPDPKPNPKPNP